jgi:hypothetical protein
MRPIALVWLALMSEALMAQSYRPLLDTNAYWQDENAWINPGPNTSSYECIRYFLDGDSILNDTSFHVLRMTGMQMSGGQNWFTGEFVGLVREDTVSHRVYIRPLDWQTELLFYDFSAGVGPYPSSFRFSSWSDLVVQSVDTVLWADGPHRRMFLNHGTVIIEGIGATSGFLASWQWGEYHWLERMVCHTVADSANYEVFSYDCPCGSYSGVPTRATNSMKVGPSPTYGLCYLHDAPPNAYFLIRSMDGRVVLTGRCSNNSTTTIDLTALPAAIYLLVVIDDLQPFMTRIVKQ